eukprot:gene11826-12903_t
MDPVLPLELIPFDETVELTGDVSQMSVEQYMSWVRVQAKRLPSVYRAPPAVVAAASTTPQSKYMPFIDQAKSCPEDYLPSEEWEIESIHQFSELRMKIANLQLQDHLKERKISVPPLKDKSAWIAFTLGEQKQKIQSALPHSTKMVVEDEISKELEMKRRKLELMSSFGIDLSTTISSSKSVEKEEGEEVEEENEPRETSDIIVDNGDGSILPMIVDEEIMEEILQVEEGEELEADDDDDDEIGNTPPSEWQGPVATLPSIALLLQFDQVLTQRLLKHLIEWLEEHQRVHSRCFQWIYSLLAYIEKPIHREMVAEIRRLFRLCCDLRAELSASSQGFSEDLAAVNLLITITGIYFGQSEQCSRFSLPDEQTFIKPKNVISGANPDAVNLLSQTEDGKDNDDDSDLDRQLDELDNDDDSESEEEND